MSKSSEHRTNVHGDVLDAAIQILRLLSSKNGSVLRRLLLTADAASLTQSMVSKDAAIVRQHASRALADVFYKWVLKTTGLKKSKPLSPDDHYTAAALSLESAFRDRRLRVVSYKMVKDLRRHPVLMFRACWCCFTVFAAASALALRRIGVSWLEMFSASIALTPKKFAASL